ncbi:MAG: hypothetical protein ACOC6A_06080 [Chloroflexota bacterium]
MRVKPVFVANRTGGVYCHPDGTREALSGEAVVERAGHLATQLGRSLEWRASLLDYALVTSREELVDLMTDLHRADAVLLYFLGEVPVDILVRSSLPLIGFSGPATPLFAVINLEPERRTRDDITIASSYRDIDEEIFLLAARKAVRETTVALVGYPLSTRLMHLPSLTRAQERLGVRFKLKEVRELVERMSSVPDDRARSVAQAWLEGARDVAGPGEQQVLSVARAYVAMRGLLQEEHANAMAINCLDMFRNLGGPAPCFAVTKLRDDGIQAACELDVVALLTMLVLGHAAHAPVFMGNVVTIDTEEDVLGLSHCVTPTRLRGYGQEASPYWLRDYHGSDVGVTGHVHLEAGQQVTIGRLSQDLERMLLFRGELVECSETGICRTTLRVRVEDARRFLDSVTGNHHMLVLGDYVTRTKALCSRFGITGTGLDSAS